MKVPVDNLPTGDITSGRVTIPMSEGISLLIGSGTGDYPSSRIQKGPVLIYRNKDLSEEGIGFGVPVIKFQNEALFPGGRHITLKKDGDVIFLKVDYDMNLAGRIAVKGKRIESRAFYWIKEYFSWLHREHPLLREFLKQTSIALRHVLHIETRFEETDSGGLVSVMYTIHAARCTVYVSVDMSEMKKEGCTEVNIMNEQGASYFDRYHDSDGITLAGNAIGTWNETFADEAKFIDSRNCVTFALAKVRGSRMFRGRELIANRLAWAGLAYVLPPHTAYFAYNIRMGKLT